MLKGRTDERKDKRRRDKRKRELMKRRLRLKERVGEEIKTKNLYIFDVLWQC